MKARQKYDLLIGIPLVINWIIGMVVINTKIYPETWLVPPVVIFATVICCVFGWLLVFDALGDKI